MDRYILNGVLASDNLHVITNNDGYVPLTDIGNHDVPVPVKLLIIGNSKEDSTRVAWQQQERDEIRNA